MPPMATTHTHDVLDPTDPEPETFAEYSRRQACVQHDVALQARPPQRIDHHGLVGSTR